jgi:hypothetical protein
MTPEEIRYSYVFKFAFYNVSKPGKLDQAVFGNQPVRNQAGTLGILIVFFGLPT